MSLAGSGPRFLAAARTSTPGAILIGAPLDRTESFRSGTRAAPDRIRTVSDVLETYSPRLDRDLEDFALDDWGDLPLDGLSMEGAIDLIRATTQKAIGKAFPLMIGGEHTATLGAIRGVQTVHPELFVLHIDAHLDLRDTYDGQALSHATVLRRVSEHVGLDHLAQFAIRSGIREEFELGRKCLSSRSDLVFPPPVRAAIGSKPIYLTIDIDALDPSSAPGTGCPEPGGPSFSDVLEFLYSLEGLNVVAADVMEVLPSVDVNDVTSVAAAKLIRESILLFGKPCQ